jgi:hypothetical protein
MLILVKALRVIGIIALILLVSIGLHLISFRKSLFYWMVLSIFFLPITFLIRWHFKRCVLVFQLIALAITSGLLVGLAGDASTGEKRQKDITVAKGVLELYRGYKADQALLRKHEIIKNDGKEIRVSSGEACEASVRIFSHISFLFRTRAEVLELLGDPAIVSDYNKPVSKDPSSPLVYIFDTGYGGWKYTISFDKQSTPQVNLVQVDGID